MSIRIIADRKRLARPGVHWRGKSQHQRRHKREGGRGGLFENKIMSFPSAVYIIWECAALGKKYYYIIISMIIISV